MSFLETLRTQPQLLIVFSSLFGLIIGSFLNVVTHRLPRMMEAQWRASCREMNDEPPLDEPAYNLIRPRSCCPGCGAGIAARDNIPVLSFLLLHGRASCCGERISWRYPLVEAVAGALCGLAAWHFGYGLAMLAACALLLVLLALTVIDAQTQYLPDNLTLPLLWLGLLVNLRGTFAALPDAVLGAVFGYLALWLVYWAFKLLTGKEGMGYGDFKLLAALGAWFGWQMLPVVILLSSLTGALTGLSLMAFAGRGKDVPIPFGPYLAGGGLIALFCGPAIMTFWHALL